MTELGSPEVSEPSRNPYTPPGAGISEAAPGLPIRRALLGSAIALATLIVLISRAFWSEPGELAQHWGKLLTILAVIPTLTGALILMDRRLRWYWVAVLSPVIATMLLVVAWLIAGLGVIGYS